MKKLLFAVAAMALVACGGKTASALDPAQNDSLNVAIESLKAGVENVVPEVKQALENDSELKTLVEKAVKGELDEAGKATLFQKLKTIGSNVILGNETLKSGLSSAVDAVQSAGQEEVTNAAAEAAEAFAGTEAATKVNNAVEKAEQVQETAEQVKQSAEQVKGAVDAAKNALDALKK